MFTETQTQSELIEKINTNINDINKKVERKNTNSTLNLYMHIDVYYFVCMNAFLLI